MERIRRLGPWVVLVFLSIFCSSCGGGSTNVVPPPPQPDFSLSLSQGTLTLPQGNSSSSLSVSVNPLNGFSATVQVSLSGVPSGVTSNPASPFAVTPGNATNIVISAASNAATGTFTITAQGTSGSLSHSTNLSLTVQQSSAAALPRTTYARTDSVPALDDLPGEPRRHHIAYDPANKHIFVANLAMNEVDVLSSADASRITQISVAGATSVDLSPDGTTVWVGTLLEQIVGIDAIALQIKSRNSISGLTPIPDVLYDRPEELFALSNGQFAVRLRQAQGAQSLLALWNPATNNFTNLSAVAPTVFQRGAGPVARTQDHTRIFAAANDSTGEIALFDASGNILSGPQTLGGGAISLIAANADGTRYAAVLSSASGPQIFLLDANFNQQGFYAAINPHGIAFSSDRNSLYVSEDAAGAPIITVLDGHNLRVLGQVPDAAIEGHRSEIELADETQMLFGLSNRGVSFIDASKPSPLPAAFPSFAAAPITQPSEGPVGGGTAVALAGQGFESTVQVRFGSQSASSASVTSSTQIQAASPPSAATGVVNVSAYFPSGWLAIAPDSFSYGPQVLEVLPNAGTKAGGDIVQIYGYGFGSDPTKLSVKVGGANATVQKVETNSTMAKSFGADASYPFALERITLLTPSGTAGKVDIVVTAPSGSATQSKAFQYLQFTTISGNAGLNKFVVYDQPRQRAYLSNIDHVDVFDVKNNTPAGTLQPAGGPLPTSGFRGMALTPDGTTLVVADFGAQNVYLINPDSGATTTVAVGGIPGFTNSGPARVAPTSAKTVFVALSGSGGSGACSTCIGQLDLTVPNPALLPLPQNEVSTLTGAPLLQANGAGDHVFLAFANAPGGPLASWDAVSPGQFNLLTAGDSSMDLSVAADGTAFALRANSTNPAEVRDTSLTLTGLVSSRELEQIPGRVEVPGIAMHPSGALLYIPFLTGAPPAAPPATGIQGGVDIVDAHTGKNRLRIFLPEPYAMLSSDVDGLHGGFLAVDENGQRVFAVTSSGLTIVQLAAVPLSAGTLSPASGSVAGGTSVTLRGSGFQSGIKATLGGKALSVTWKDSNTISFVTPALSSGAQQLVLTNPDGETYALDAAFAAN